MKRNISLVLAAILAAATVTGCGGGGTQSTPESTVAGAESSVVESASAQSDSQPAVDGEPVVLYSIMTTNEGFDAWLADAEEKSGLDIEVIAAPTDSDTRQQKITTVLSSGDTSIDVFEINDEMASAFKNAGWLEPLQDTVMTPEVMEQMPAGYVSDMITTRDGDIIGVPGYKGFLSLWVNQQLLDQAGVPAVNNKEDFLKVCEAVSKDGVYGYGGSWEKTYSFNEIATFVNLFGGDYLDWTKPENREAIEFLKSLVDNGYTPKAQFADKYEQMNQKFIDGKYAMLLMWGSGNDYDQAGVRSDDQIHVAMMPEFKTRSIFTDSWSYVLNKASTKKESALKLLEYTASKDGGLQGWASFERYPARTDSAADAIVDSPVKEMYASIEESCVIRGRPMLPQTMEFISDMGTIFQNYIDEKITADEFCQQAQEYVERYS